MLEASYGSEKHKQHKEAMATKMARYLDTRDCRRQFILDHFEGHREQATKAKQKCCDNCTRM